MAAQDIIKNCLDELGGYTGASLTLDDRGVCSLEFGDNIECTVEVPPGSDLVYLHSEVVRVSAYDRSALYEDALALNLYGLETGGAFLALDRDSDRLVLCFNQPAEALDPERFAELVANFVETVERLRDRLNAAASKRLLADGAAAQPGDRRRGAEPAEAHELLDIRFQA